MSLVDKDFLQNMASTMTRPSLLRPSLRQSNITQLSAKCFHLIYEMDVNTYFLSVQLDEDI